MTNAEDMRSYDLRSATSIERKVNAERTPMPQGNDDDKGDDEEACFWQGLITITTLALIGIKAIQALPSLFS